MRMMVRKRLWYCTWPPPANAPRVHARGALSRSMSSTLIGLALVRMPGARSSCGRSCSSTFVGVASLRLMAARCHPPTWRRLRAPTWCKTGLGPASTCISTALSYSRVWATRGCSSSCARRCFRWGTAVREHRLVCDAWLHDGLQCCCMGLYAVCVMCVRACMGPPQLYYLVGTSMYERTRVGRAPSVLRASVRNHGF
eukprot:SAG25_NODE_987_length_4404_cov_5.947735_7_plen_198_part_00